MEDEAIIALAEASTLRRHGYDVAVVHSGDDAVARIESERASKSAERVDLVLMDIDLGSGMDGTEAASRILQIRELPVVFLTGHGEREMVERVRGITRYGYVLKDSGEFVLTQAIETAFQLFSANRESAAREQLYRSVANLGADIVVRYDAEGRWQFVNDRAARFWGVPREELETRDYFAYVHPDDHEATAEAQKQMLETQEPLMGFRNRQRTPAGWRTVEWNSQVVRDAEGRVIGFQASGRDVSRRHELEAELQRKNDLLEKTMEASPVSIVVADRDGSFRYANRKARELLGFRESRTADGGYEKPDWTIGSLDGGYALPETRPFNVVRRTGAPVWDRRHTIRRADGAEIKVSVNAAPLFSEAGDFDGVVAALEDITGRLAAEERLRENDRILQSISESVPGAVYQFELTPDGTQRLSFISQRIVRFLGYTPDEAIRLPDFLIRTVHEDDRERVAAAIEESYRSFLPYAVDHRLIAKSGDVVWIAARAMPGRLPDGRVQWTGVAVDITDRKETEAALVRREAQFRTLFEQAAFGIILSDGEAHIVDANPVAASLLGYTREELRGMSADQIIPPEDLQRMPVSEMRTAMHEDQAEDELERRFIRKDGVVIETEVRVRKLQFSEGRLDHMVMFSDVTAKRRAERKIKRLLREKNLLLREIYHRVKNDLNLVQSLVSLQKVHASGDEARRVLGETANRIAVMGRVYEGLHSAGETGVVPLAPIVRDLVQGLRESTLPFASELALDMEPLEVEHSVSVAVGIIVNEFVTNSAKHAVGAQASCRIDVRIQASTDYGLRIVVWDDGPGFPEAMLSGGGYGYGVTVVEALTEQYDGSLRLYNDAGAVAEATLQTGAP